MRRKNVAALAILLFMCFAAFSDALFTENLSGASTGPYKIADGYLPVSFSVHKSSRLQILPDGDEKATLAISSSYALSDTTDYVYYDKASGTPRSEWLNNGQSVKYEEISYFDPTGQVSLTLSQKFDEWTYSIGISSRFSLPQEAVTGATNTSGTLVFSTLESGTWKKRYSDINGVYAYPWFYGERQNLTSWMSFSASRSVREIRNLSSFDVSLSFEMGPWWMLNRISNSGITLSDYYRVSASCSQSMLLKDEQQSISLRWLRISLSHSDRFAYTFGSIVPRNKLNSFRLRGYLTDSVTLSLSGPQMLDSGTSVSMSFSYNNSLCFGGFENEKSGESRGVAFISSLSSSMRLSVFGFISFYYGLTWNMANGYSTPSGLYGSGEVSMSFSL